MFWSILKSDLARARFFPQDGQPPKLLKVISMPLFQQPRVLFLLRLAINGPRWAHRFARIILRSSYAIEVGDNVHIGKAILLPHPQSIILGAGVTIGDEVSIGQFATIGGNYRKVRDRGGSIQKVPVIGSRVMIGPGSVIGGPVIIGDNVVVGANSVITKDIPSNRLAFGLSQISKRQISVDPTGCYTYTEEISQQ